MCKPSRERSGPWYRGRHRRRWWPFALHSLALPPPPARTAHEASATNDRLSWPDAEEGIPRLIGVIEDNDAAVRLAVIKALGNIGPGREDILSALMAHLKILEPKWKDMPSQHMTADPPHFIREAQEITLTLGKPGPKDGRIASILLTHMEDTSAFLRLVATEAIGKVRPDDAQAISMLGKALDDEERAVRAAAARALGELGPAARELIPVIVEHITRTANLPTISFDRDSQRKSAHWKQSEHYELLECLVRIDLQGAETIPLVAPLLQRPDLPSRVHGLAIIARFKSKAKDAVPSLIIALKDEDELVREETARALGEIGPDAAPAVGGLIEALSEKDKDPGPAFPGSPTRWISKPPANAAAEALGKLGPAAKAAIPALVAAEENYHSLSALARIDPNVFIPKIVKALQSSNKYGISRHRAIHACIELGSLSKSALPFLIEILKDQKIHVLERSACANALASIGSEARDAIPVLIHTLRERAPPEKAFISNELNYGWLRRSSAEALEVLSGLPGNLPPTATFTEEVIRALSEAGNDQDEIVRSRARNALSTLKRKAGR
jgi:HEAT repeat protein